MSRRSSPLAPVQLRRVRPVASVFTLHLVDLAERHGARIAHALQQRAAAYGCPAAQLGLLVSGDGAGGADLLVCPAAFVFSLAGHLTPGTVAMAPGESPVLVVLGGQRTLLAAKLPPEPVLTSAQVGEA